MAARWQKELFSPSVYYGTRNAGLFRLDQIMEAMADGSIWFVNNVGRKSVTEIAQKLRIEIPEHPSEWKGIVQEIRNGTRPRYKRKWWEE